VDKPAGTVVVPAPGAATSLWRALEQERDERLWAVHRIDRGTSGVVLFARDADTHRELSMAFEHGRVVKTYLAFVYGAPSDGCIDVPLHAARRGRTRLAEPGETGALDAQTDIRVIDAWDDAALIEAHPRAGRHHQIRVHVKSVGTPLLVDPIYAPPPAGCAAELPPWRLTLHAHRLELDAIRVESPLPDDLSALRDCLASADTRRPPSG
jgi:23S rRNA-/tRNA-specific pseudouridylate synthase